MNREEMLNNLRIGISSRLSEKRYLHTIGVEKAAVKLAELCLPEKCFEAAAAALLHDITKEAAPSFHIKILSNGNKKYSEEELMQTAILHSFSAPFLIKRDFLQFASEEILSAVEKHTVADADMSILDEIIFLADFIEDGRKYPDSQVTRQFVFDNMKQGNISENLSVLHKACLMEIESSLLHLKRMGKSASKRTLLAKASLSAKI